MAQDKAKPCPFTITPNPVALGGTIHFDGCDHALHNAMAIVDIEGPNTYYERIFAQADASGCIAFDDVISDANMVNGQPAQSGNYAAIPQMLVGKTLTELGWFMEFTVTV